MTKNMKASPPIKEIGLGRALLCAAGAVACFSLAYAFTSCEFLIAGFFACLFPLARLSVAVTAALMGWLAVAALRKRMENRVHLSSP